MGLFQHKQTAPTGDTPEENQEHFFDEYYREELRNHGRWYFEKVINENSALFKQDLDATVAAVKSQLDEHITARLDASVDEVDAYLKEHMTKRLDEQFAEYTKAAKETQEAALQTVLESAREMKEQHEKLSAELKQNVSDQSAMLHNAFEDNKAQIIAMKDAQASALDWLNHTAQAMQEQHAKLIASLEKNVADQEAMLVNVFKANMGQIIEHYLLGALGDQYDLKAQLPAIIKQMEEQKETIVGDMNL